MEGPFEQSLVVKVFHNVSGAFDDKPLHHKHFLESAVDSFIPENTASDLNSNVKSLSLVEKVAFAILHGGFLAEVRQNHAQYDDIFLGFWAIFRKDKSFWNENQKGKVNKITVEYLGKLGSILWKLRFQNHI